MIKLSSEEVEIIRARVNFEGEITVQIASGSMEPVLKTGEKLRMQKPPDLKEISVFDIVVFMQNAIPTCHAVLDKTRYKGRENFLITGGLATRHEDRPVYQKDLIGIIREKKLSLWQKLRILTGRRF